MDKDILTIVAHTRAKAGMESLLLEAQKKLVEVARQSHGCLRYELNVSAARPGEATFVEQWASRELWLRHMQSSYMDAFRGSGGQAIAAFELHELQPA